MKKDNTRIPVAKTTEKSLAVIKTSLTILSAEASKTDHPIGVLARYTLSRSPYNVCCPA
jgi:hypothetical protein